MATSAPVALGIGGVAAVLLMSGIQGKSVGSILQGDFGAPPNPAFGKGSGESASPTSLEGVSSSSSSAPVAPVKSLGYGTVAPNPFTTSVPQHGKTRIQELEYGLAVGLKYKEELEKQVKNGRVSRKEAEKLFTNKYPYYEIWYNELKTYLHK